MVHLHNFQFFDAARIFFLLFSDEESKLTLLRRAIGSAAFLFPSRWVLGVVPVARVFPAADFVGKLCLFVVFRYRIGAGRWRRSTHFQPRPAFCRAVAQRAQSLSSWKMKWLLPTNGRAPVRQGSHGGR